MSHVGLTVPALKNAQLDGKAKRKRNPPVPKHSDHLAANKTLTAPMVPSHLLDRPTLLTPAGPSGISMGAPRSPDRTEIFLTEEEVILPYPQSPRLSGPTLIWDIPTPEDETLFLLP